MPRNSEFFFGYARVLNLYKGDPRRKPPPVARILEELRASFDGRLLVIRMWSQKFGAGFPDYNPRWRINVRGADGQLRRQGPLFEPTRDYWLSEFSATDKPFHRLTSTYYFNWGRSYALPAPLLNPSSTDGRYRPTAIRSPNYHCWQDEKLCKFIYR